jgi:hypothetical protein
MQLCNSIQVSSTLHMLHFKKTKFSNNSSDMLDLFFDIVNPAQLNSLSTAALAGRGVFSLIKRSFSNGLKATEATSVLLLFKN